jgi:hypothetical protein
VAAVAVVVPAAQVGQVQEQLVVTEVQAQHLLIQVHLQHIQ